MEKQDAEPLRHGGTTSDDQQLNGIPDAHNSNNQLREGDVSSSMTRQRWLSWFTQRGADPPFMLKYRSSDTFIIGTISLAVFTVCIPTF